MSQGTPPPFDIAVVGGGLAGVTFAIALSKFQIPFTLYESASAFGEIGAGVAFGPNAVRAMKLIDPGVHAAFETVGTSSQSAAKQNTWFDFRKGVSAAGAHPDEGQGKLIHSLLGSGGGASVHRAHFLDEMVKLLPEGVAKFGKRLVDVEQGEAGEGVKLVFADGSEARHGAVVGADGIKSQTRKLVLGKEDPAAYAVFTRKYAFRGLIPMDKAVDLLGEELAMNSQMYLGQGGHILTFPVAKGKTMNVVAFRGQDEWTDERWVISTTKERLYKDYEGWSTHVQSILKLMHQPDIWALFQHPPASTYTKGRICLIGDAAHASTPHQGAGAGMAVEDAYVLSEVLSAVKDARHLPAAFEAYEKVRWYRTQKLVATSNQAGRLYEFELEGTGNDEKKIAENLARRMSWIWDEDLEQEVASAKAFLDVQVQKMA